MFLTLYAFAGFNQTDLHVLPIQAFGSMRYDFSFSMINVQSPKPISFQLSKTTGVTRVLTVVVKPRLPAWGAK